MTARLRHWLLVAFFWLPLSTRAEEVGGLRVHLQPLTSRARSAAPLLAELSLNWSSKTLLEGRVQVELWRDTALLSRWESAELALATGRQQLRVLLPAWPQQEDQTIQARLQFVTRTGQRLVLDSQPLVVGGEPGQHISNVLVCDPVGGRPSAGPGLEQSLRLEQYIPRERRGLWSTGLARFTPEEMPVQALQYCAFDLVYLRPRALAGLRDRQLTALRQWVRGGGSLLIAADQDMTPAQLGFLNYLVDAKPDRLVFPMAVGQEIHATEVGCGRLVVLTQPGLTEQKLASPQWRTQLGFLWRMSPAVLAEFVEQGTWKVIRTDSHQEEDPSEDLASQLVARLLPRSTRPIPLRLLALVLAGFVVLVGPVDYFGLGWLKRRRYTWVLFPAVTLLVTAATVQLANHYLGRGDHQRSLTIVDLDAQGQPVRQLTCELFFAGRDRELDLPVRNALLSRIDQVAEAQRFAYRTKREELPTSLIRGVYPTQYQFVQPVRQWQPQLFRTLSFEASTPVPALNWAAVRPNAPDCLAELTTAITGPVAVTVFDLRNSQSKLDPVAQRAQYFEDLRQGLQPHSTFYQRGHPLRLSPEFVRRICFPTAPGSRNYYQEVEPTLQQLAPKGGPSLEDLAWPAPLTPNQRLVTVLVPDGENSILYRRVHHAP